MNKHRVMEEERLKAEQKIKIKKIAFNNNSLFCRCIYTYVYAYIHLHTYAPCKDMWETCARKGSRHWRNWGLSVSSGVNKEVVLLVSLGVNSCVNKELVFAGHLDVLEDMYTCVYVCKHIYIHICMSTYIYICLHIYTHVYIFIYIHVYIYIYIHVYVHVHISISIHIWNMYVYIRIFTYIYMCVYIYIYHYIYVCQNDGPQEACQSTQRWASELFIWSPA